MHSKDNAPLPQLIGALDRSDTFRKLVGILADPQGPQIELGNIWGSSYAYLISGILIRTGRPALLITPSLPEAEDATSDLSTFLPPHQIKLLPEIEGTDPQIVSLAVSERLGIASDPPQIMVATIKSVLQPLPSPSQLKTTQMRLLSGGELKLYRFIQRLVDNGWERVEMVGSPGEFASRGGIIDLYPFSADRPVRVELFGDRIESIRYFDPQTQISTQRVNECLLYLIHPGSTEMRGSLTEYLSPKGCIIFKEPAEIAERVNRWKVSQEGSGLGSFAGLLNFARQRASISLTSLPVPEGGQNLNFRILSLQRFSGALANVPEELAEVAKKGYRVLVFCNNPGEQNRLREMLHGRGVPKITYLQGPLSSGFSFDEIGLVFIPHHQLFNRYRLRRAPISKVKAPAEEFLELQKGDYVVHLTHGIGRFLGMEKISKDGSLQEFLVIQYQGDAKVYVPVSNIELVQKYVGGTGQPPALHRLGTDQWKVTKQRAYKATQDLARELLAIQALRQTRPGISYPPDTEWQHEFEASFPYEDTEDQIQITRVIKQDMSSPRPMDRLICGDVGYGKTELAMRAAFKAALFNKQTAVLVPTTILAQQHAQTFRERMADYPVCIEVLSRFKTRLEQKRILDRLASGKIDIIIGTHRLLQPDVVFKDLGLVIIDEEQRFGVEHKERLKKLRATVDILTLTATPIPRTLHMALLNIKDISTLWTPPRDRLAIHTEVCLYNPAKIRQAILFELERGGQVFFLHNRVYNIDEVARQIQGLVPEASVAVAHGQMQEDRLEQTMIDFLDKKIDVLVATTIIESGLDIPNVNTIIINNADQFGLADLHQLRGRVGRYKHRAYAYFLIPPRPILPQASQRLKAIEEFSELGAGFKIAMRDLEIRGVGNILGREQHGHIAAVGYDLYAKLLQNAIKNAMNQEVTEPVEPAIHLDIDFYIPEDYIPSSQERLRIYRRLNRCGSVQELDQIQQEMQDRYGGIPEPLKVFLKVMHLKILARRLGIIKIIEGNEGVTLQVDSASVPPRLRDLCRGHLRQIQQDIFYLPKPPLGDTLPSLLRLLA